MKRVCFWTVDQCRDSSLPWPSMDPGTDSFWDNLCGSTYDDSAHTSFKEKVTCEQCLALLSPQPGPAKQRAPDPGDAGAGTQSAPTSPVDRPAHYTAGGVECIDAIDAAVAHLNGAEAFYVGQMIKYVWRWKLKNGVEDLKKCRWYLNRLISKVEAK